MRSETDILLSSSSLRSGYPSLVLSLVGAGLILLLRSLIPTLSVGVIDTPAASAAVASSLRCPQATRAAASRSSERRQRLADHSSDYGRPWAEAARRIRRDLGKSHGSVELLAEPWQLPIR
jgi:hypothetical protein